MRHILDVVCQRTRLGGDVQQTVLEALVGEVLVALGIHHAHAVNHETIGVHVGGSRTQGNGPQARLGVFLHVVPAGELYIYLNALCFVVLELEGYCAIIVENGGWLSCR